MLVKFYLAHNDNNGQPVNPNNLDYIRTKLAFITGGLTEYNGRGLWINDNNVLTGESTSILETYTDNNNLEPILALANVYKLKCRQESVMLIIDNEVKFL